MAAAGRVLYASLQLLDRPLLDVDGRVCGKVDDLDLAEGEPATLFVTAVLSGPGVLARRMGCPRLGRWLERAHARLHDAAEPPSRIPFSLVKAAGSHIELTVPARDLDNQPVGDWVRDRVISQLPGARRAAE